MTIRDHKLTLSRLQLYAENKKTLRDLDRRQGRGHEIDTAQFATLASAQPVLFARIAELSARAVLLRGGGGDILNTLPPLIFRYVLELQLFDEDVHEAGWVVSLLCGRLIDSGIPADEVISATEGVQKFRDKRSVFPNVQNEWGDNSSPEDAREQLIRDFEWLIERHAK